MQCFGPMNVVPAFGQTIFSILKTGGSSLVAVSILCCGQPLANASPIYKTTDTNGQVVFSDSRPGVNGTRQYRSLAPPDKKSASTTRNPCRGLNRAALEKRGDRWQPLFTEHAARYDLDPHLVRAIARVESCFDPQAVSRAGARGIMQLMPATARQLGVTEPFNAPSNIAGGVAYFSSLYRRFNQDTQLALAAYNAGPAAVDKFRGIPPYSETRDYVARVLRHYQNYLSLASR